MKKKNYMGIKEVVYYLEKRFNLKTKND